MFVCWKVLFARRVLWVTLLLWLQVKDLTRYLDPSGLGVISFEDFHRGIRAIKNGGEFAAVLRGATGRHQPEPSGKSLGEDKLDLVTALRWVERSGAFSNGAEKGGTAAVVVGACFPICRGSS